MAKKGRRFWAFWIFPSARTQKNICAVHMRKITDFLVAFPKRSERFWACFRIIWEPLDEEFPVTGLTVKFRRQDALSHRDFMGSFLAQGVVRASLGDILAEEGRAVLFVKTELAPHFLSQIDKIGRVGVQITKGFTDPLPQAHSFQPMGGVVASER